MAGGKETPRQKMIGMMYLVLTALLALNVSSTVIEKFIFLNQSLERANVEAEERNIQILEAMRESVEEKGSKPDDMAVIKSADELRLRTKSLVDSLELYKERLIQKTGGYEPNYEGNKLHLKGKTDYDGVGHYMMAEEEGGEGNGKILRKLLTDYRTFVIKVLKDNKASQAILDQFQELTPDADEDPVYKEDPNQQGKKWSQLAFEYSPTHAGLATLSELQANILSFETRGFDYLQTRTGLKEIIFDEIKAMVNPESKYVVSGNSYSAEMFIAASASHVNPEMSYNGQSIDVQGGVGTVKFVANLRGGTDVGNGVKKKSFEASIKIPTAGGDTVFSNTIEYFVVKPAIVVSSNSAVSLYRNCANEIRVDVPGLTGNYNPKFSGQGGKFIPGNGAGELNIIPDSRSRLVKLNVSNAGQELGDKEFGIKEVPAPTIVAMDQRGNAIEPDKPIATSTRGVRIVAISDKDFEDTHPKDSKFAVTQGEASLLSGGLVRQRIPFRNGRLNLSSIASRVRKGDVLVVKIQRVVRGNFLGENENFLKFNKTLTITY